MQGLETFLDLKFTAAGEGWQGGFLCLDAFLAE